MKIKADEITSILKQEIQNYQSDLQLEEVGIVIEVGDGIAKCFGLSNVMSGEFVEFQNGIKGQAFNLESNSVGVIIYGDFQTIEEGFKVKRTNKILQVPVGENLLGRVVNALGEPIDGKGEILTDKYRLVESPAPGIAMREPVNQPVQTGIKAIDSMIPIGRGQRELIIGDRGIGKTSIVMDTIINQKKEGIICVYVGIGQKASTIAANVEILKNKGALDYTIIVSESASNPAPLQFIAPYTGCSIAEYFMYEQGKDTLVVYDDLSKQAVAYRQMSLLLRRPPGREAYPGDVFYLHSRLLERSAKLNKENGGGSLTALPIIETQEGEVSAYIPTNVISITDGQIYLQPNLFSSGIRPAIDVGISVSRVGSAAQTKAMKKVAGKLKLELAQYRELEAFAQLGTELDAVTQSQLERGKRIVEILKQSNNSPLTLSEQVIDLFSVINSYMDKIPVEQVIDFSRYIKENIAMKHSQLIESIEQKKEMTKEVESELSTILVDFVADFLK